MTLKTKRSDRVNSRLMLRNLGLGLALSAMLVGTSA